MLENLVAIVVILILFNIFCGGKKECYVITIGVIGGSLLYASSGSPSHSHSLGLAFWGGSVVLVMAVALYFFDSNMRKDVHDGIKDSIRTRDKDFWFVVIALAAILLGFIFGI